MIPIRQHYTDAIVKNYLESILEFLKNSKPLSELESLLKCHASKFSIEDLLIGDVPTLRKIAKEIGIDSSPEKKGKVLTRKGRLIEKYEYFRTRNIKRKIPDRIYNISDLVDKLGITVCPYCNRSFIYSTVRKESTKTTCQIDHFFEKSKYPYLCLSLFNLIPVCTSCNHSKLDEEFKKSPFEIVDVDKGFKFSLEYTKPDYTKPDSFKVVTKTPDIELDEQRITLGLEKLYEKHNDIGHELFLKQHIYSEDRIMELCESFPELFTSPNEVRQLILGNYIDKKDVGKRPLAKMTRDIMMQLGFIEE